MSILPLFQAGQTDLVWVLRALFLRGEKNGPHLFMLQKKIIARKRSGPQIFLEKMIDGKVQDRDEFPEDKKMAQV